MKALAPLIALAWAGAASAAPIELPVNLKDGATWTIRSERSRLDDGVLVGGQVLVSTSRATFRVGETSHTLILEPLGGSATADLPSELRAEGLDFALELEVDDALTPIRMRNWPRLRDSLLAYFEKQPADPRFANPVKAVYRQLSDEDAPSMFTPHLGFLGLGQGLAGEIGEAHTYEDKIENPLGGPPIDTKGAITIQSHDKKAGRAVVVWTQTLDPASMKASVAAMAKQFGASGVGDMSVGRDERCRFDIDVRTGLVERADCESLVTIAGEGQTRRRADRWLVTQTALESN